VGIFDRFTGITGENLTQSQIEGVANTLSIANITQKDIEQLGIISMLLMIRQGGNHIIQGLGAVSNTLLADAIPVTVSIPTNQAWQVNGIEIQNTDMANAATVTVQLDDGSNQFTLHSASVAAAATVTVDFTKQAPTPLVLSPQLQIKADQTGESSGVSVRFPYQVIQT